MTYVGQEIESQPQCWQHAVELAAPGIEALPRAGERLAVVGCGTSLFMAQAFAVLREQAGLGETDAFAASEFPSRRSYDRVLALTRSGTTTEVLELLARLPSAVRTVAITADGTAPVRKVADETVVLEFADERSVVQTRFATTALVLLRAHLGEDLIGTIAGARRTLREDLPVGADTGGQFTFLGRGWTVGLAHEAALKLREASLSWSESYPAMEYRHGPVSVTDERSVVWTLGEPPAGLAEQVQATGALWVATGDDPLAELVRVQRLAVALAARTGIDPDRPRHLSRSVILDSV
ncbi:MAG: SIS domain-containing protein [Sciscionella sp.]